MVAGVPEHAVVPVVPAAYREPACRNCGAPAGEQYCPRCGQETSTALPTARQFLRDAAGRYVAFDGRMWRTLAALLFRPGFLTREYFAGRRRRYIRPARLFLVLSLLMFLVIRLSLGVTELRDGAIAVDLGTPDPSVASGSGPAAAAAESGETGAEAAVPSAGKRVPAGRDSEPLALPGLSIGLDERGDVRVDGSGPFVEMLRARMRHFNALPREARIEQVVLGTLRYGPYAMFVLLPAFALLLMLVYAGSGRRHPARPRRYAEHLVFAAHNHAFFFVTVTIAILLPAGVPKGALALWSLVYGLWSMRAVYGGRWIGVLARAVPLGVAYAVLFVVVTAGLLLAAVVVR